MYIDPRVLEAPLYARLFGVALAFVCLYVAGWLAGNFKFNLRAFIAWTVGGTAAVWLVSAIF